MKANRYLANWTPYIGATWLADTLQYRGKRRTHRAPRQEALQVPRRLRSASQRQADHRCPRGNGPRRTADGLGVRREPRLRHPARRRLLGTPVRPGQPAWHVLPSPRGAAQPEAVRHPWTPLEHLFEGQPRFRAINSMLSEAAVLGFEYGYCTAEPEGLTIWEAQFGDFANMAQVVIDQFLSSSEAKWGRFCGLVLMLAARVRRPGARALLRPPGAIPPALRGGEHAGLRADDARADVPPAEKAAPAALSQAARHHESQEPAAAPAVDLDARGSVQPADSRCSSTRSTTSTRARSPGS